ncbi:MAG: mercuric transporter MerT family protein [bacterium]|nr:mercuric transporter MerT family protein [bacterium]
MKEIVTGIGSVVSAFLASLCCIGPVVGVLLGVGGLGAAASLEVYRPYFLGITFVFLGGAFYFTYGRKEDCEEGEACEVRQGSRWQRTLLWITTVAALIFAAAPYLLQWVV